MVQDDAVSLAPMPRHTAIERGHASLASDEGLPNRLHNPGDHRRVRCEIGAGRGPGKKQRRILTRRGNTIRWHVLPGEDSRPTCLP